MTSCVFILLDAGCQRGHIFTRCAQKRRSHFVKANELAKRLKIRRETVYRLAKAGKIPGTRVTKGGQRYFVEGPALTQFINQYEPGLGGIAPNLNEYREWVWKQKTRRKRKLPGSMIKMSKDFEAVCRMARAARLVAQHPLSKWSQENISELRSLLLPIAKQLWPQRKASQPPPPALPQTTPQPGQASPS
jgi:excisionase family DNA binding protein